MMKELKNNVVVITGGAEGIGYDIAEKYLQQDAKVIILLDINETKGAQAASTLNAKYGNNKAAYIKCDVTKDLEAVSNSIIDTYKTVDVLVNNAGIVDEHSVRRTIEINTIAVIEWSMKFREHMRNDKGGKGGTIINVASTYGFHIDPYLACYKASKHAVMGFSKTLGHELNYNKTGVRIVAICPGFTHSALTAKKLELDENYEEFKTHILTYEWQTVDAVGKAAVDVFKTASSGTAWAVVGGGPIEQV